MRLDVDALQISTGRIKIGVFVFAGSYFSNRTMCRNDFVLPRLGPEDYPVLILPAHDAADVEIVGEAVTIFSRA